jgi:hypothetical protein
MGSKDLKVIFFESVLAVAFDISRTVSKNSPAMSRTQSLGKSVPFTSIDGASHGNLGSSPISSPSEINPELTSISVPSSKLNIAGSAESFSHNILAANGTTFHNLPPILDLQYIYDRSNGNPPGDVWRIPNVKHNHVEKTDHPCQFPVELVGRLICALSNPGGLVVDPFMGVGSTGVAAVLHGRRFAGADTMEEYVREAQNRINKAKEGTLRVRNPK